MPINDYLGDEYLGRVKRAYGRALLVKDKRRPGSMWSLIDAKRQDVHFALTSETNDAIRAIFAAPAQTDLFYGVDNQCKSLGYFEPAGFLRNALSDGRARLAEYQARRLRELGASSVLEIGPGMGRVAYHAFRDGVRDYTTVDLPLGLVAQACFLGATLGPENIWLEGEPEDFSADRVKIFPVGCAPQRHFSVALNVDSLTEMPAADAFSYLEFLSEHADVLLSINHDKNLFKVAEVAWLNGAIRQSSRPCPPWPGYIEEVFHLRKKPRFGWARRMALCGLAQGRLNVRRVKKRINTHHI